MSETPIILHEKQYGEIKAVLTKLRHDAASDVAFLIDKNGQSIAVDGDVTGLDTTSLASLAAGNVAATGGMAQLIGEREFPTLAHEGENGNLYICVIGRALLVVVFNERSSLGLVKLRTKQASRELLPIIENLTAPATVAKAAADAGMFADITDEDIDSLFN